MTENFLIMVVLSQWKLPNNLMHLRFMRICFIKTVKQRFFLVSQRKGENIQAPMQKEVKYAILPSPFKKQQQSIY